MRVAPALLAVAVVFAGCGSESKSRRSDAGVTGGDFHSLVSDPSDTSRLFVGGHSNAARSDDGGKTWSAIDPLAEADAMAWSIDEETIWVSGHPGLRQSTDGGRTFAGRNDGLPNTDVHAFGALGSSLFAAGPGLGVAGSTDGGSSWATLSEEHGQAFFGRIIVDPADPSHLVAADVQNGAVESRDGGRTWSPLGTSPAAWVSSTDALRTIYVSGGSSPQRSVDGGETWTTLSVPPGATLVELASNDTLYAGVHDGAAVRVWVSADGGVQWRRP